MAHSIQRTSASVLLIPVVQAIRDGQHNHWATSIMAAL